MQDLTHQPQDQIIANNCGQGHQEKARSFTRFRAPGSPECPIPVQSKAIECAKSVGNGIEEQEPRNAPRWPELEQAIQHE